MPAVGQNTPDRSYLSIREVLELLVKEFPDVTISKIRFLESRGLIHPERTPSGYRKFYEADVERLRWILLQQREHFLPLKVIKGRLDQTGAFRAELSSEPSLFDPEPGERAESGEGKLDEAAPEHSLGGRGSDEPPRPPEDTEPVETAPVGAPVGTTPVGTEPVGTEPVDAAPVGTLPADAAPVGAASVDSASVDAAAADTEPAGVAPSTPVPVDTPEADAAADPDDAVSEGADEAVRAVESSPTTEPQITSPAAAARRDGVLNDGTFSLGELIGASGASPELVTSLLEFGLIESKVIAGVVCFDGQGLEVARLASGFARFGIEPRHLRSIKHAAERQAGLYAQVVTPLLRQRNPEARERARDDLSYLADLGSRLQSLFVDASLRELGGR